MLTASVLTTRRGLPVHNVLVVILAMERHGTSSGSSNLKGTLSTLWLPVPSRCTLTRLAGGATPELEDVGVPRRPIITYLF